MFEISDFSSEITDFIKDLDKIGEEIKEAELKAMEKAAKIVLEEQKRILSSEHPRLLNYLSYKILRNDARTKAVVGFNFDKLNYNENNIEVWTANDGKKWRRKYFKGDGGYHQKYYRYMSIKQYKDFVFTFVLEFGRPGISATTLRDRRPNGANRDVLGRKIGKFKGRAPIRRAWFTKREKALDIIAKTMFDAVEKEWGKGA
ncbi:MAG: hypothetical protein FWG44_03140 [Oscillospiraceae bacterium]|nr:hypothetical protein [Oscillospiraceae bacterium]